MLCYYIYIYIAVLILFAIYFHKVTETLAQISNTIKSDVGYVPVLKAISDVSTKMDVRCDFKGILHEVGKVGAKVQDCHSRGEIQVKNTQEEIIRAFADLDIRLQKSDDITNAAAADRPALQAFEQARLAEERKRASAEVMQVIANFKKELDLSPVLSGMEGIWYHFIACYLILIKM